MSSEELFQSYINTTYSVFIKGKKYDLLIDKALPESINSLLVNGKSAVIITAWNPRSHLLPVEENKKRNDELNAYSDKYTVYKAIGKGNMVDISTKIHWSSEDGFFIIGIDKVEADKFAIMFEQNAYLLLEYNKPLQLIFSEIWYEKK